MQLLPHNCHNSPFRVCVTLRSNDDGSVGSDDIGQANIIINTIKITTHTTQHTYFSFFSRFISDSII